MGEVARSVITYHYPHAHIRLLACRVTSWSGDLCLHAHDASRWVSPAELEEMRGGLGR